ncbi:MAG: alpha/beta fold hydrolase [Clostridia bacterium]|nr:alpha/beta fold hydrolase [Clostridia bacterium]
MRPGPGAGVEATAQAPAGRPDGELRILRVAGPGEFPLESGACFGPIDVAFRTWGRYDPEADGGRGNAVLVCHALTGGSDVGGFWPGVLGSPALDPARRFVICANVLGGCYGTTGPASRDPATGRPYGLRFPQVTVGDMVRVEALLLERLGVERLALVTGGSLGGMRALAWALLFPERVARVVLFGAPWASPPLAIAWNEIGRQAILSDPDFQGGDYYGEGDGGSPGGAGGAPPRPVRDDPEAAGVARFGPARGLAIARMLAMTTYRSGRSLWLRQGRRPAEEPNPVRRRLGPYATELPADHPFAPRFRVETYLHHQGERLVRRFDANTYLYLTRAMDLFDAGRYAEEARRRPPWAARPEVTAVGISTDILYPCEEVRGAVTCLRVLGYPARYVELASPHGHDAFLIEADAVSAVLAGALGAEEVAGG